MSVKLEMVDKSKKLDAEKQKNEPANGVVVAKLKAAKAVAEDHEIEGNHVQNTH